MEEKENTQEPINSENPYRFDEAARPVLVTEPGPSIE